MRGIARSNKAGREIKSATLVPKFQQKRKRNGQSVTPAPRSRRDTATPRPAPRLSSVSTEEDEAALSNSHEDDQRSRTGDISSNAVRRSARATTQRAPYNESDNLPDVDAELQAQNHIRDQTPLFAQEDEEEEQVIRVKEEPMDDDDVPLQAITDEPVSGAPHLPMRSDSEIEAMREGAAVAGHRTHMGTGLEDPEDGFVDHTEGRHIRGSPDPPEDTGLEGMGDVVEEDGKEFKPVTTLSYSGKPSGSRSSLDRQY
jgi:hypothetical protein